MIYLSEHKENTDRELTTAYFNSTAKTVTNSKYDLNKSFQKFFNRIDN